MQGTETWFANATVVVGLSAYLNPGMFGGRRSGLRWRMQVRIQTLAATICIRTRDRQRDEE